MADQSVAIITGAGSGMGRATALQLAEAGWAVVLVGRTREKLDKTAEQIAATGAECLVHPADVTDPQACQGIAQAVKERFGRLDALVNAAGYAALAPIAETSPEMLRQIYEGNVDSVVNMTRSAWPLLKEAGGSTVVNVSSMAAFDPFPGFGAYGSAKAAVNMITTVTGREGRRSKINAVCVAPGAVETEMLRGLFDEKAVPPEQTMPPEEVAGVIRDCILGERSFKSGETIQLHR